MKTAHHYCTDPEINFRTNRQIQWKQLVATAPTQIEIYTLPAVPHTMN